MMTCSNFPRCGWFLICWLLSAVVPSLAMNNWRPDARTERNNHQVGWIGKIISNFQLRASAEQHRADSGKEMPCCLHFLTIYFPLRNQHNQGIFVLFSLKLTKVKRRTNLLYSISLKFHASYITLNKVVSNWCLSKYILSAESSIRKSVFWISSSINSSLSTRVVSTRLSRIMPPFSF